MVDTINDLGREYNNGKLYQTYCFDKLIDGAFEFVEEHNYLIDEYWSGY